MTKSKLFLFGPPRLERGGEVVEIGLHKAIALLAYLAVTKREFSRDALATLFWPEGDQSSARASLRRTLYSLNKTLGEGVLASGQETVGLSSQAELWLDVDAFQESIRVCSSPDEQTKELVPECLARLAKAIALYTGDFLAGFTLPDSPAFDEWQFFEAERLRRSLAQALNLLVETHQARGEFEQAIEYARRWVALEPLHEPAHRHLMQLYSQSGQQAAALRQYQLCARTLQEELGVAPQPETTELYESIRLGREPAPLVKPYPGPETKYVKSGEVHIAYQVLGHGPVDLIFVGGFVGHLEQLWEQPDLAWFFQQLASFSRLILFDKRGMGLSDRVGYAPTLEHTMDDIFAVMSASGSAHPVLMGVSEGGTSAALFAATYPERVSGLILYGTLAKGVKSADYPWALTSEQYDKWLAQMTAAWGTAINFEYYAPSRIQDERMKQWWAKSLRLASSPGAVRAVLEVLRDIDVRVALPAIRTPTLVMHRTGDRAIRVGHGRFIASQIPVCKYVELSGDDHWWWVGDASAILTQVEAFLKELREPAPSDRVLATILALEFGGERATRAAPVSQASLASYKGLLNAEFARFRGRTIAQSGDRLLVMFDGPSRAIQCAGVVRSSAREMGIPFRAGLHTGECELSGERIQGVAVPVAASMMEKAMPGEVLVSSTVKDLVIGSGFEFKDRGGSVLGTVPGEWHLFALVSDR